MNNVSKFQPTMNPMSSSLNGSRFDSSRIPNIPKSTSFQPSSYNPSKSSVERPPAVAAQMSRYSYQNSQYTPTQNKSPYSRYSDNKGFNGTPSASSVHSIGISGENSIRSSFQVHCEGSQNTGNFKKELELSERKDEKENKSPNAMTMSLVHTTKPGVMNSSARESFTKTNDENMFDRKQPEEDEPDSDGSDDVPDSIIPVKYLS